MNARRFSAEQVVNRLRGADVLIAKGQTVAQACKHIGVTGFTYYRWRREYGGLKTDQAKRLRELERENARLKRLQADAELDKAILRVAAPPNGSACSGSVTRSGGWRNDWRCPSGGRAGFWANRERRSGIGPSGGMTRRR